MTPLTWVAGDWNCVPDVTLDVDNANPLNYANGGADALAKKMEDLGLIDERREQLEGTKEFTRKGVNIRGEVVSTRLDRWYVPGETHYLLTFEVQNNFVFKKKSSDHSAVYITLDNKRGVSPNIPDQWELRTPLLYCETASSSSEYRLRHNIFDKSGDPFKLASALSRRYTQRADPHHHQHHLIIHLAARALASGLTSGRAGQVCTLRRSKPPRQSISLSARIRPRAQGLDGRDRVRGGRTTSSTLSYV